MKAVIKLSVWVLVVGLMFLPKNATAQSQPTIDYWSSANMEAGLLVLNEFLENGTAEDAMGILLLMGILDLTGYDIYAVRLKFSNQNYRQINVLPKRFRIKANQYGQSYPLEFFLVKNYNQFEHWKSVKMPSGSSIELYAFYFAPQQFRGQYLSVH